MKTANRPLAGLVHSSQATIHNLTDHVRATAEKPRQLLDTRRRNELFRELGKLHYDVHQSGNALHKQSVNRLLEQLDDETHEQTNNHGLDKTVEPDVTGKGDE